MITSSRIFASSAAFIFIFGQWIAVIRHDGSVCEQLRECRQNQEETVHSVELKENSIMLNAFPFRGRYLCERETIVSSFFTNSRQVAWERTALFFHPITLTNENSLRHLDWQRKISRHIIENKVHSLGKI